MDKVKLIICIILFLCIYAIVSLSYNENTNLGGGYMYNPEQKHVLGAIDIPPVVVSYRYDKQYIVIKQKPRKYANIIYEDIDYPFEVDSIFYWIINKSSGKVYGPLNHNRYDSLFQEYRLSDNLLVE